MKFRKCFYHVNQPSPSDYVFLFFDKAIVLLENNQVPQWHEVDIKLSLTDEIFCFAENDTHRFLLITSHMKPVKNFNIVSIRGVWDIFSEDQLSLARLAWHIHYWRKTHRFCGVCATENMPHDKEQALQCPQCHHTFYPRISPCIIVLIYDEERLLLARSPHFPEGVYSTIAGFVEPGETLEQALHREVKEEVGVSVKNIEYFGSQPWPFPDSLMVGFTAQYSGGELVLDPVEIEDAQWFDINESLPLRSSKISISCQMINAYINLNSG